MQKAEVDLKMPLPPKEISRTKAFFLSAIGKLGKAKEKYFEEREEYEAFREAAFWASKKNYFEAGNRLLLAAERISHRKSLWNEQSATQISLATKAYECYQKWQELEGKSSDVLMKLGECCYYLNKKELHMEYFNQAIEMSAKSKKDRRAKSAESLAKAKHYLLCTLYQSEFSWKEFAAGSRQVLSFAKSSGRQAYREAKEWLKQRLVEYMESEEFQLCKIGRKEMVLKIKGEINSRLFEKEDLARLGIKKAK
ncbi:MAG: hypothetical protein QW275_00210 [Candidatus Anstonellaceae archaeon]